MQAGKKGFVYSALLVLAEASVLEDSELLEACCDELDAGVSFSDEAGLLELLAVSLLESDFDSLLDSEEANVLEDVLWLELALELLELVEALEELCELLELLDELDELDELLVLEDELL